MVSTRKQASKGMKASAQGANNPIKVCGKGKLITVQVHLHDLKFVYKKTYVTLDLIAHFCCVSDVPPTRKWSKYMEVELKQEQFRIDWRRFMRLLVKRLGPSEISKMLSELYYAPNVSEVFMEERDSYLLENFSWQDIEPNTKGERVVAVAKADDRLIKREPITEDTYALRAGKQKKIVVIDLTDETD